MKELNLFEQIVLDTEGLTIYGTPEEPMFVAKDISDILGYTKPYTMMKLVSPEFIVKLKVKRDYEVKNEKEVKDDEALEIGHVKVKKFNKPYEVLMLTEYGLYQVLFRSNHPIALDFTNKVMRIIKQMRLSLIKEHQMKLEEYKILMDESTSYKTVTGYLLTKGLDPKEYSLTAIGKRCTKLSNECGYDIKKVEHPSYGFINSYKVEVIESVLFSLTEVNKL